MLDGVSHFHFGYPPLMEKIYQNGGDELVEIFKKVKKRHITTSLDMATIDPNSSAGKANWLTILQKVLPYVDVFMPSIEELCFMLAPQLLGKWQTYLTEGTSVYDALQDVRELSTLLMTLGAKTLLIKCGVPGLYYRSLKSKRFGIRESTTWDVDGFQRSFEPEKVVSATGAGDTCIAAFLTAMCQGRDLATCARLAAAAGACCVTTYDALSGLKPLSELERRIDAGWKNI
jgi:sugar/nucleoside kinase (ribokinase family)